MWHVEAESMGPKQALPPVTARPQKAADLSASQWGCCTCPPRTALGPRMARGVVSVTSVGPTAPCNKQPPYTRYCSRDRGSSADLGQPIHVSGGCWEDRGPRPPHTGPGDGQESKPPMVRVSHMAELKVKVQTGHSIHRGKGRGHRVGRRIRTI